MKTRIANPEDRSGFTLVELLVVITVIVVLLALLAPALDQAVYQAELAGCGARLHGIASGATTYASGSRRSYPYRPVLDPANATLRRPSLIRDTNSSSADDRTSLRAAFGGLDILIDPLAAPIDPDLSPKYIHVNYNLWFGMYFPTAQGGGQAMRRIGDRLQWRDASRGQSREYRFQVLASDVDWLMPIYTNGYILPASQHVITSHPDADGVLYLQKIVNNADWELAWWTHSETHERGPLELNFAMADASVARWDGVKWDDDRMARVPTSANGGNSNVAMGSWMHLPQQQ